MTNLRQYVPLEVIEGLGGPILHVICADEAQQFVAGNRLNDEELELLSAALFRSDHSRALGEVISTIRPDMDI